MGQPLEGTKPGMAPSHKERNNQQAGSGRSRWWAGLAWGMDSVGLGVGGGRGRSTG